MAELISITSNADADGYPLIVESHREVFVDVKSVRRTEFYTAMQKGLNLSVAFVMRFCDYSGEKLVKYDGKQYKVERAYTKDGELIELNCSDLPYAAHP